MINLSLNELTFENLGQWPKPIKISVVILLSILFVGLLYWMIAKENFEQYDVLLAQEKTLKSDFEMKQHLASNLQAYRNQIKEMTERFGNMLKQLPTQNEMPGLLEDISKTGIASGLVFELFAPLPEVLHDFYIELPIKTVMVGNYHQFAIFLSRVAQMSRIVTLHDFTIERWASDNGKPKDTLDHQDTSGDQLRMEMTIKIYRYRTQK